MSPDRRTFGRSDFPRRCVCLIFCSDTGKKSFSVFFAHYCQLWTLGRSSAAECDSGHTFRLYIPRQLEETAQSPCGAGAPFEKLATTERSAPFTGVNRCDVRCRGQRRPFLFGVIASVLPALDSAVEVVCAGMLSINEPSSRCMLSPVDCCRGDLQPTGMGLAGLLTTASSNIRRNSHFRVGLAGRFFRREQRNYLSECAV